MFDTPDLGPLCIAPFVAAFVGVFVYAIGSAIGSILEKRTGKKQPSLKPFLWFLVIIVVPIACFASIGLEIGVRSPAPWFKPSTNDIVGRWELSLSTINAIQELYHRAVSPAEIVFSEDGTFHLNNNPTFWGLDEAAKAGSIPYVSGSGTWHLGQVEGAQRVEWVVFAQFKIVNEHTDNRLVRFYFEGYLPPYALIALDNDSYVFFRYQKR